MSNNNDTPNTTPTNNEFSKESQSLLDDHKEDIPENLYLTLSNLNNKLFKENSNNFYKITYMDYKVSQPAMGIYLSRPHIKQEILTLTDEMFSIYTNLKNRSIRERGFYLPTSHNLLGLDLKRLNTNPLVNLYADCCKKNIDCDCCDEESLCEAPETHNLSLDFDVVIINIKKL
jgi:hypothetical protein